MDRRRSHIRFRQCRPGTAGTAINATYENDAVRVTAEAQDEGAIPQNASFRVDTVSGNSSVSYDTVSQKLTWIAENKGSSLRVFLHMMCILWMPEETELIQTAE